MRAIAVAGQIVRVVFNAEPKHESSSGLDDAFNPQNYAVSVTSGTGASLRCIGVHPLIASVPAYGLRSAGEYAIDVQTDRPMVAGLTYSVTVTARVVAANGQALIAPFARSFIGADRPRMARSNGSTAALTDLANDSFGGGVTIDSGGDWAPHSGRESTRKRVLRRVTTKKGAFAHLPGYGTNLRAKEPMTNAKLRTVKTDASQQIAQEPDVMSSKVGATQTAQGITRLDIQAKTTEDQDASVGLDSSGMAVVIR